MDWTLGKDMGWQRVASTKTSCVEAAAWVSPRVPIWAVALAASVLALSISMALIPVFYATNDDTYIQQIMAGVVSPEPAAYVTFTGYAQAWLVSRLFVVLPGIPWWTLYHLFVLAVSMSLLNSSLLAKFAKELARISAPGVLVLLTFLDAALFAPVIGRLQFTTTSAVALVASLFSIFVWQSDDEWQGRGKLLGLGLPTLLFAIGMSFRPTCGEIALVFLALASLWVYQGGHEVIKGAQHNRRSWLPFVMMGLVATSLMAVQWFAYAGSEWSEALDEANPNTTYIDYPHESFEENPEAYEAEGWDGDLAYLAARWFALDERETGEAFERINAATSLSTKNLLSDPVGTVISRLGAVAQPTPVAYICLFCGLWFASVLMASSSRERAFSCIALGIAAAMLGYLVIQGRLPERAAYSVLFPAAALIAASLTRSLTLRFEVSDSRAMPTAQFSTNGLVLPVLAAALCLVVAVIAARYTGGTGKMACLLLTGFVLFSLFFTALGVRLMRGRALWFVGRVALVLFVGILLFPGIAGAREYGYGSNSLNTELTRQSRVDAFYDYVEAHPDCLFVYDTSAMLTPQGIWQMRWPQNQTSWGGWRYDFKWFDEALRKAGFSGQPTTATLLDDNVYFVSGSAEVDEVMGRYVNSVCGPTSMRLVASIAEGVNVYKFEAQP